MKLLLAMNLSPRWVELLTQAGFDASHWSALGQPCASDAQLMAHAVTTGSVVVTHDLDFGAVLAATHSGKPSVVQVRSRDLRSETIGELVIAALHQTKSELKSGALVTIDPGRTRVRILPLESRS